jgi:sugar phosphate isomerase/epimerase
MKIAGPEETLRWDAALKFADVAFRRADELGIKYIVLGSAGARKAPDGFSKDKAREQFVEFCKRLAVFFNGFRSLALVRKIVCFVNHYRRRLHQLRDTRRLRLVIGRERPIPRCLGPCAQRKDERK